MNLLLPYITAYKEAEFHKKMPNALTNIMCTVCNKHFQHLSILIRHMDVHSTEPLHPCKICPKKFKHSGSIYKHLRNFHGVINDKPKTPSHIVAKSNAKGNICTKYSKIFRTWQTLQQHMKNVHTESKRTSICEYCGKIYSSDYNLKDHLMAIHFKIKWYCKHCGSKYTRRNSLNKHLRTTH